MYKYMYMFFKQEKPAMDDFGKEEIGKILRKMSKFLQTTLQMHKLFLHILLFQNILSIFIYFEKKKTCIY